MEDAYQWVPFYEALADKLLTYADKRHELFELIKKVSADQPMTSYFHFERGDWWGPRNYEIDPFSVMGAMNRGMKDANRAALANVFANTFEIKLPAPTQFAGIPVLDNRRSVFAGNDEVWALFVSAMAAAEAKTYTDEFQSAFERATAVKGNGLAYITMGLYWIRPNAFMPLDNIYCSFVSSKYGITVPSDHCSGDEYVRFLHSLRTEMAKENPNLTFPEVSRSAWIEKVSPRQPNPGVAFPSAAPQQVSAQSTSPIMNKTPARNIILYGPPGTGKTYSSVLYAVAIVEEKPLEAVQAEASTPQGFQNVFGRYKQHAEDGLIAFTTFHESFGYEEFIEGIRPVLAPDDGSDTSRQIEYEVYDGVFKAFCDKAGTPVGSGDDVDLGIGKNPTVWKVSLEGSGDNPTRTECMANNHIRIGWDEYGEILSDDIDYSKLGGKRVLDAFYNGIKIGDIVLSCYSGRTVDAIGVLTGDPEWHNEYEHYKRLRKVKWLATGLNEDVVELNGGKTLTLSSVYKLSMSVSDALSILRKVKPALFTTNLKIPNRVFIIDEINRGNISKIFGELITLIEPSRRIGASEETRSILPYSHQNFGVPNNVYIIGTMNTADRSIAMMDTALRRRFEFVEMQPESETLRGVLVDNRIDVAKMLDTLNKRITVLLDREHTIGHSYLLPLKSEPTIERLAAIFRNEIVPLLQEYFYDDYEKIQFVLGDNQKPEDSPHFVVRKTDTVELFGNPSMDFPEYYEINRGAFTKLDAYAFLQ